MSDSAKNSSGANKTTKKRYYKKKISNKEVSSDNIKDYLFDNYNKFSIRERQNSDLQPRYGEIYTCDLGLNVGSEMDNIRPCIIVTPDKYNENSTVITVIPISNKTKTFFHQVVINEYTVEEIESKIEGIAKLEQIRTISKGRLGRKIGRMSSKGMKLIKKAMAYHFSIMN